MGRRGGWGLDPLGVKYLRPDCAGGWAELGHIGLECWYLILKRELEPSGARGTRSLHVDCGGGWFHIFRFNNFLYMLSILFWAAFMLLYMRFLSNCFSTLIT